MSNLPQKTGSAAAIRTISIMGIPIANATYDEVIAHLGNIADGDKHDMFHVVTANPEIVMTAGKDEQVKRILLEAGLITPDGIGIVLAAKWKGEPLSGRVTGYDMLMRLLERANRSRWSFYFLGTDEETSRKAISIIADRFPNVQIAGRRNGFFRPEDEPAIVEAISAARPDFLIVAMGAPNAERWIYRYKSVLNAKVVIGVGGSLDVIAGKVKRAPDIWIKLNLEWLYRLLSNPSRWRRQLVLPVFAAKAFFYRKKI